MGRRRVWFAISGCALVLGTAGIVTRGMNYGVEFTGGQLTEYATERAVNLNDLRRDLAAVGVARAVVQESGAGNVAVRTGRLTEAEQARVNDVVAAAGGSAERVRSEFIGPTIGSELRRRALIALGIALGAQLLYLAVRFRWTYGAAAVVAMFQDVVLLIGAFAWLGREIDGVFLAALLTVIGYSINDSVVVFDRIREQRRQRIRDSFAEVANEACLQTIPRTINTGLGALFILVALFLLGGDTLTDFALALLIGIVVGTYSSVFTAAPVAVVLSGRSGAGGRSSKSRSRPRRKQRLVGR
jgi:SecD/SecF fusion protein